MEEVNEIQAQAVMRFVNTMIAAYDAGFIETHQSNLADVYQCAKAHIETNYSVTAPAINDVWGNDLADMCKNGIPHEETEPS